MSSPYGPSIPTTEMSGEYIIFWNHRPLYMKDQPYVRVQIRPANDDRFIVLVNDEYRFHAFRDKFARPKAKRAIWHLTDPNMKQISEGLDPQVLVQMQIDLIEALILSASGEVH
jgi:hypothetical protein